GLDEPGERLPNGKTSLRDLEAGLPPTVLHYCFQCNHYQPGRGADPAIMTAWALGPRNKAEVVARFLPELGVWDQRRDQMWSDITAGKAGVAHARHLARLRILLDRVSALIPVFQRISLRLADFEKPARAGHVVVPDQVAALRREYVRAKKQLD